MGGRDGGRRGVREALGGGREVVDLLTELVQQVLVRPEPLPQLRAQLGVHALNLRR